MQKYRLIIWLLILWLPSTALIFFAFNGQFKNITDYLYISAKFGGTAGVLIGAIAALITRDIKLSIWIFLSSLVGCILFVFGLVGLIITLSFARDMFQGELFLLKPNIGSRTDTDDVALAIGAELGEILGSFLLSLVSFFCGILGGILYVKYYLPRS